MQTKKYKLISTFFVLYLITLGWIIVFKLQLSVNLLPEERVINLLPFYDPNIQRLSIYIGEKIYNLLLFVPFGLYISLLKQNWSLTEKIKPIFLTSLAFEMVQLLFGIGTSDITDLIQNTLGGVVGIGIFHLADKIFKSHGHLIARVSAIGLTVLMAIAVGLIKTFIKIKLD